MSTVNPEYIRYLQTTLPNTGAVDGIAGTLTMAAIDRVGLVPLHWSKKRRIVGTIQALASVQGIEATLDGYDGPQTQYAFLQITAKDPSDVRPDPTYKKGAYPPTDTKTLIEIYGPVGTNQVRLTCPYPLRLAWDLKHTIRSFSCHAKVRSSAEQAYALVLNHYGFEEIRRLGLDLWGGCLNVRKVRGGNRYSEHSWGIAIDTDPSHNQLRWDHTKARLAQPEYSAWHSTWESVGWVNLGKAKDMDWMHSRFNE